MGDKTLRLTVKKYWFDMIKSGVKKEEYREVKRYWIQRLCDEVEYETNYGNWEGVFKKFTHVEFKNGYSKDAPMVRVKVNNIRIGKPKVEWCIDEICSDIENGGYDDCFIIELGDIVA